MIQYLQRMEVFIDMNDNVTSKSDLWSSRIKDFQKSGLSRQDWCQQNGIPQSTFSYWFRKQQPKISDAEEVNPPVFARLPSEQEIRSGHITGESPVTICLPENIRIEVNSDCPPGLMASLLQALKTYA